MLNWPHQPGTVTQKYKKLHYGLRVFSHVAIAIKKSCQRHFKVNHGQTVEPYRHFSTSTVS
jgi:hypothetical protein